jgi:HAD superfamily hydrolase (TIGR01509 family)
MYQAVFFDAFNTLIGVHWPGRPQSKPLPLQATMERKLSRLDANWQAAYGRAHGGAGGQPDRRAHLLAMLADRSGVAHGRLIAPMRRNEHTLRHWLHVYEDTLSTLQSLSEVCRLGVISNAWPYLESILQLLGLWEYFESIIISAQVGLSKPNPAIYELAVRRLHIRPEQAAFVDDMPQNVVAAENVGLKGLWLVRGQAEAQDVPAPYRHLTQIYSLQQVIPLVERA